MFIDGLKIFVSGFVYCIIPLIILIFLIIGMSIDLVDPLSISAACLLIFVDAFVYSIAVAYIAYYVKLSAAFEFGEILEIIGMIG